MEKKKKRTEIWMCQVRTLEMAAHNGALERNMVNVTSTIWNADEEFMSGWGVSMVDLCRMWSGSGKQ